MNALVIIILAACVGIVVWHVHNSPDDEPVVDTELKYFGIKDSGYYVSVWPKDKGIGETLEFKIAGVTYRKKIDKYLGEFVGRLIEDPYNLYDPMAIKILAADGHLVGYVPKDMTSAVRGYKKLPCKCYCYIGKHRDDNGETHYFTDCYIDT